MSSPTVSVVIPCFNQGRFLRDALDSVLRQTLQQAEIVVVDDGSTDDTAAVARRYPDVRCIRQPNRGLASARNAGVTNTTGEAVVFLDADDRLRPDALAIGARELLAHPTCALVWGRCVRIDEQGTQLPTVPPPPVVGDAYEALLRNNFMWTPAVVMFRRSLCAPMMRFNPAVDAAADYELYLRLVRHFPIHGHAAIVAEYRVHRASMSRNASVMLMATMEVLRNQRPYVAGHGVYARAYDQGQRFWRAHYGEQLLTEIAQEASRFRGWRESGAMLALLARYYPRGLAAHVARTLLDTLGWRGRRSRSRQGTRCPEASPLAQDIEVGAPPRMGSAANSDVVR
jgi:glycosyltransferase involved in cell wall biosynthesis